MTRNTRHIFKYNVSEMGSLGEINMPDRGRILHVGQEVNTDEICIWVEIDKSYPECTRRIRVFGTGECFNRGDDVYIGTVQCRNGLVWHVYDAGYAS